MGRPRKNIKDFEQLGADPVLRDENGLSPADEESATLTQEQILKALKNHIEAGITVTFDADHWYLQMELLTPLRRSFTKKRVLKNSGSLNVPVSAVVSAADFTYTQAMQMQQIMASSKNREYGAMGEVIGKDGAPIDNIV